MQFSKAPNRGTAGDGQQLGSTGWENTTQNVAVFHRPEKVAHFLWQSKSLGFDLDRDH